MERFELVKMKQKLTILMVICLGLKSTSAWICNDFVCDATECYGQGTTCDSEGRPCQVLRKVHLDREITTFTCSPLSECESSAGNTSYDGLVMNICCEGDLCNTGLGGSPFEENQKYCYNTGCVGAGCTEKLIKHLDEYKIGAFCKADENGCEITKVHHTDPETGEMLAEEMTTCARTSCEPLSQNVDGFRVTMECCDGHMCNGGSAPQPNAKYCHVYTCIEPPCMSVTEAAAKGLTGRCQMTDEGCYFSNTTHLDSGSPIVAAGCAGQTAYMEVCIPQSLTIDNIQTDVHCCDSHECNVGEGRAGVDEVDPNKSYCHVYDCMSSNCMTLAYAIKLGKTTLCEMNHLGCFSTTVIGQNSMMVHSGCVGQTPSFEQCIPSSVSVDDTHSTTACCTKDRCNNGLKHEENEIDPSKNYCHTYSCMSTLTSPCLTLSEAIEQGVSSVCEMKNSGCFESTFTAGNEMSLLAGCVGAGHMTSECDHTFVIEDGTETMQRCCATDRCNDGQESINEEDDTPFCYTHVCSSSEEETCLTLEGAISMGKTVRCEKTEKGCYAINNNGRYIEAGCVGEKSGVDYCEEKPSASGVEVVCCDTSGCNDGVVPVEVETENTGSSNNGLPGIMIALVISVCIRLHNFLI